jgi:hypothetical protein
MKLSNGRPAVVRALEDRLWRTLFALAADSNATSASIYDALEVIGKSSEFEDALKVTMTDPEYHAFGGPRAQPVVKRGSEQAPQPTAGMIGNSS